MVKQNFLLLLFGTFPNYMYRDSIGIFSIISENELSSIGSFMLRNYSGGCTYNVLAFNSLCGKTRYQDGRETDKEIIVIKRKYLDIL